MVINPFFHRDSWTASMRIPILGWARGRDTCQSQCAEPGKMSSNPMIHKYQSDQSCRQSWNSQPCKKMLRNIKSRSGSECRRNSGWDLLLPLKHLFLNPLRRVLKWPDMNLKVYPRSEPPGSPRLGPNRTGRDRQSLCCKKREVNHDWAINLGISMDFT